MLRSSVGHSSHTSHRSRLSHCGYCAENSTFSGATQLRCMICVHMRSDVCARTYLPFPVWITQVLNLVQPQNEKHLNVQTNVINMCLPSVIAGFPLVLKVLRDNQRGISKEKQRNRTPDARTPFSIIISVFLFVVGPPGTFWKTPGGLHCAGGIALQ